jgi:hypothetical protein
MFAQTIMRLEDLSEDVLRQLYLVDHLTESEIALRYGTTQVQVWRLRKKFGIPTVLKSDRRGLPDVLTPRLRSILVGSMLGDGHIRVVGASTARYEEFHSESQRAYLDWKASEWGPFLSRVAPVRRNGHVGWRMFMHACRAFYPFWGVFYPEGAGNKTFVHMPIEWVDGLALAVWFMDDGSRAGGYFRFSVSPDRRNQAVQLRILGRFGIAGKLYVSDGNAAIHVQNCKDRTVFLDLIRPHIHPSMSYKLVAGTLRKSGSAPRDVLIPDRLGPLLERGLSASAIAHVFSVSRQSVCRAMDRMGAPRKVGRPGKDSRRELDVDIARERIDSLDSGSPDYIDRVVDILAMTEMPIRSFSYDEIRSDAERLRRVTTCLTDGEFRNVSWAGSRLCEHFFPHRWDARYRENLSARQAWYSREHLRKAVRFQLAVGDPITPVRVFRAVQAIVRGPTNFRPALAKAIVEAFCPPGGTVLDPCAGYGGRCAGTLAAGRAYFGVDPHPDAGKAHRGLHEILGGSFTFLNVPFEDASLDGVQADLVFTSPPYFSVERYSDDTTQSWVRYPTWDEWVRGFLHPVVLGAYGCLKPGGMMCVNAKAVRYGRKVYPIGDVFVDFATRTGFDLRQAIQLPIGRLGKAVRVEPLYVLVRR